MSKRKQKQVTPAIDVEAAQARFAKLSPDEQADYGNGPANPNPVPKTKRGLAATMAKYRAGYVDGKSCGDAVASRLAGMSLGAVIAEAEQVSGLEPGALVTKYAGLNLGQQRMCAGNRIRAAAKKTQKAVETEIAALIPKA